MFGSLGLFLEALASDRLTEEDQGRTADGFLRGLFRFELYVSIAARLTLVVTGDFGGENGTVDGEGLFQVLFSNRSMNLLYKEIVRRRELSDGFFPSDSDGLCKKYSMVGLKARSHGVLVVVVGYKGKSSGLF